MHLTITVSISLPATLLYLWRRHSRSKDRQSLTAVPVVAGAVLAYNIPCITKLCKLRPDA